MKLLLKQILKRQPPIKLKLIKLLKKMKLKNVLHSRFQQTNVLKIKLLLTSVPLQLLETKNVLIPLLAHAED
jgi:hypothetical protein